MGVMWTSSEGRSLKDCPVTLNTDPYELKKAQFFTDILSFTHHLSEESVLAVLNEKVHQNDDLKRRVLNSGSNMQLGEIIKWRLEIVKKSRSVNRLPHGESTDFIIQAIVETYGKFADFVSDVKAYGDEIRPIESLWSTYVGADVGLTQLPRCHLPSLIPREPLPLLVFVDFQLDQSCAGTWGNSALASTVCCYPRRSASGASPAKLSGRAW